MVKRSLCDKLTKSIKLIKKRFQEYALLDPEILGKIFPKLPIYLPEPYKPYPAN